MNMNTNKIVIPIAFVLAGITFIFVISLFICMGMAIEQRIEFFDSPTVQYSAYGAVFSFTAFFFACAAVDENA